METNGKHPHKIHFLVTKSQRIMFASVLIGVIICAVLFSLLGVNMRASNNSTIDKVGATFMQNTGDQIVKRFEALMQLRIDTVSGVIKDCPSKNYDKPEDARKDLAEAAQNHGFEFLAYYRVNEDNINDPVNGSTIDMLTNNMFWVKDKASFRKSTLEGNPKIAVGGVGEETEENRGDIVIISVPTKGEYVYTMADGQQTQALVAGVKTTSIKDMLNITPDDAQNSGAFIVLNDKSERGSNSFVITQKNADKYTYFSELLEDKLKDSDIPPAEISKALNEKMNEEGGTYSAIMHVNGHHVHMYCHALENSEWYLVTLMNSDNLNSIIEDLGTRWITMIVVAVVTIIVVLIVIFCIYSHFSKQNIAQLNKAREEALQASKAKSEFLSNMSHDIRTPMNAIVGMTAIARANMDNQQQVNDCLKKISLSSKHLLGLINDILDMSKIESGKMTLNMEQVSLREVLDGITTIVQPQIKAKHQTFNVVVRNITQENVYCDSVRLNQVLLNLLSNAVKYTAEEGTIEVYLDQEKSPLGDEYIRTHIRVKDNGIGMTEEFQKRIFDSFSRDDNLRVHRTEGTGLGMAITKYIVDAMKGTIELKSELGMGSQFHVTLDLEKALISEEEMVLPPWRMLIVDDDQQLCETTVISLKEIGIEADWTLDGESAVKGVVEASKQNKKYDIILLDWKLPGIDGIETAKRIRKHFGETETPILLISAYDWSEIESQARAAGICGFISKPLFKSTLFYGLKSFVGNGETATEVKQEEKVVDLKGLHVLLAEDNELNWEIAETLLDSVGITCDHAENGQICLDMLKNSKAGTYKAILMDIRMPVMNGYESTMEIRKLNHPDRDLPIIAMTADAFADDMKKCLECGMNAHIAKPIDIAVVQNTLTKFIKK